MSSKVKKKILKLKESSTLVINEKSKELISKGKKVYQFGFGQSPFPVPETIVDALKKNAHRKEYLPIQGLPELRESISKYLSKRTGNDYPKENILITPGSKEAMLLIHIAFNGEIIIPAPGWVSYEPQAEIGSNKVHWLETTRENSWLEMAEEEIADAIIYILTNWLRLVENGTNNNENFWRTMYIVKTLSQLHEMAGEIPSE